MDNSTAGVTTGAVAVSADTGEAWVIIGVCPEVGAGATATGCAGSTEEAGAGTVAVAAGTALAGCAGRGAGVVGVGNGVIAGIGATPTAPVVGATPTGAIATGA